MGRTQVKKKIRTKANVISPPNPAKEIPSIESLLDKAQSLIIQCDYELAANTPTFQNAIDLLQQQLKGKAPASLANDQSNEAEIRQNIVRALSLSFDPAAEGTCEELLESALQVLPGNGEALQALASVRMSQQRPDDAKRCLEEAWSSWKDLEADDDQLPPIPSRLSLVKLFLELSLFNPALLVLNGIMASDDQLVEAWYLEGWCFFMMAEQAKSSPDGMLSESELAWEELGRDARDCLEACQTLHIGQEYGDEPMLDHIKELIRTLEQHGIQPSPPDEEGAEWEDMDSDDEM
ncbi:hypothetical protein DL96DRAFT_1587788 [Flagelloscypha sp. PMI_526]|nr:hypothetical protein DL96DRAFT_1587788 [Flagelloscypha sp. PMI_526]